ncbi:hypothetical protein [Rhodanobacter sp. C01]|uniref:PepSY domain-containing protein n=1 Tax=Rhodanobacter sp. C01 TaxID=1945856 RepID=UPI0009850BF7|nr:hypothetical protein [Rhodanobacter sp. C01]OOG50999.1 hypothetical protein B0E50_02120 [Rhodanobacter sp. C01]
MTTYKNFIFALLISILSGVASAVAAQSAESVTMDQAVLQVQQETRGKVLSAEQRGVGRRQEYRIKVLTPDGHVRVMAVSSEASKNPAPAPSIKIPPVKNAGSKERH